MGTLAYTPLLAVCGIGILLAFHRVGVVRGRNWLVQVSSYITLCTITLGGLYGVGRIIKPLVHFPTAEIADAIIARLPNTTVQQPQPQVSKTSNERRSTQTPTHSNQPATFTENEDDFLVSVGNMNQTIHNGDFSCIIAIKDCVISVRIENRKALVTADLYSGPGFNPLEVKDNKFTLRDSRWDRNFDDSAFEVVDQHMVPMLQIIYTTPHNVEIYGVFQGGGWVIAISPNGMTNKYIGTPITEQDYSVKRLFKYPSRKYFSQEQ